MYWHQKKIKEDNKNNKSIKYPFKAVYVDNFDVSHPIAKLIGIWVYAISEAQARAIFYKQHPWLRNASTFQPEFDGDKHKLDLDSKKLKDEAERKRKEDIDNNSQDLWYNKD